MECFMSKKVGFEICAPDAIAPSSNGRSRCSIGHEEFVLMMRGVAVAIYMCIHTYVVSNLLVGWLYLYHRMLTYF